jgi:hypothetical protein
MGLEIEEFDHLLDPSAMRFLILPDNRQEKQLLPKPGGTMPVPPDQQIGEHGGILK